MFIPIRRAVCLLLLVGSQVCAYGLRDHRFITRRATSVYRDCYPQHRFSALETETIIKGNLSEDYNLARKWLKNSHYYNPTKWIRTLYRDDASYRVRYLAEKIQEERGDKRLRKLGQIMHFVQDMTSPPHVIPIVHGLGDGFEKLQVDEASLIDSEFVCPATGSSPATPLAILKTHALQSLQRVHTEVNTAMRDGKEWLFTWELFWNEGFGSKFGYYGFFGNRFGEHEPIVVLRHSYLFAKELFLSFKLQQMQQAVVATMETIHWYQHIEEEESKT